MSAEVCIEFTALPAGPALVEDQGRTGYLSHAVPASGALVPELLAMANRAVGNAPGAAALELYGGARFTLHDDAALHRRVSLDGAPLEPTDSTALRYAVERPRERRVQYLAVEGGLAVAPVLGSRSTHLAAQLGGLEGRALRVHDRVAVGALERTRRPAWHHPAREALLRALLERPIRALAGPDLHTHFAANTLARLLESALTIDPRSDRGGTRLTGVRLARTSRASQTQPMVPGAVEVAPDGVPLVLGPDHPTTGGYPLVALIARADLGALFVRRPGAPLRLALSTPARALAALELRTRELGL